ncbi:MAG: aldo/keto reductase [Kaiparowitsia implicata GSE-PSE-MK54-09C]|nr:aldo/keto reductase [Kaiparowitsia implicata GSE-PSE-MK54-09C]
MTRLGLGTVQFGLDYGVANATGKAPVDEVARILARARAGGIDLLDTAASYGDSETVLGVQGVSGWQVVTKLSELPDDCADVDGWIDAEVNLSLKRLALERVHGLLLHRPHQLVTERGQAIWRSLRRQQDIGRVGRIGYSIYEPSELDALYPAFPAEIVQAPFNVLDRRLAQSGWLKRLADDGAAVHVRSAFLQGLLLMEPAARPHWTRMHADALDAFDAWAKDVAGSRHVAALAYCLAQPDISHVIIGVQNVDQLDAALAATRHHIPPPPVWPGMGQFDLVDPRRWPKG